MSVFSIIVSVFRYFFSKRRIFLFLKGPLFTFLDVFGVKKKRFGSLKILLRHRLFSEENNFREILFSKNCFDGRPFGIFGAVNLMNFCIFNQLGFLTFSGLGADLERFRLVLNSY